MHVPRVAATDPMVASREGRKTDRERQIQAARAFKPRHFLMASAPFGPFGRELAEALRSQGARCSRIILNAGDLLDWQGRESFTYFGAAALWPDWLTALIERESVTDLITYGDSSVYSAAAIAVARQHGLRIHILEQGYFRPDWITLEHEGVNANSSLPRDPDWYRARKKEIPKTHDQIVGRAMPSAVFWIARYHLVVYIGFPIFRRFRAGYSRGAARQAVGHTYRYLFRGLLVHGHAQRRKRMMSGQGPLFLALLQRPGDSQLWRHSQFETTADFLRYVLSSFATHAPREARLMVRPHPLDPGLEPHERTLRRLAAEFRVRDRVTYVDDGKLHEILPSITGVVCVNSTAGLAAIEFGRPTAVLGRAIYDMEGLTHQGGLDSFWTQPEAPDLSLYKAFRGVVLAETQVNGAFATPKGRRLAVPVVVERLLARGCSEAVLDPSRVEPGEAELGLSRIERLG
jgi:capsular polysaccharide export protein